ncbi:MAG: fasciclin domain-containing protein [Parachlamydiaceae bacterium]|nr:fasciclin domain-containing protein [Parachlamydiaceae bacterium]
MTDSNSVMVGGAAMLPSKNIVENASNSKDHTTLVSAVKAAGLVDTLSGRGPFTVFAPTNTAFSKLPSGTVENLLKPENKSKLAKVLTFHVVSGKMNARDLLNKLNSSGGKIELKTVQGDNLTLKLDNGAINVMDSQGNVSKVTIPDVNHSNGVTHVVDTVLMPKL